MKDNFKIVRIIIEDLLGRCAYILYNITYISSLHRINMSPTPPHMRSCSLSLIRIFATGGSVRADILYEDGLHDF